MFPTEMNLWCYRILPNDNSHNTALVEKETKGCLRPGYATYARIKG